MKTRLSSDQIDLFLENLSLLLSSGVDLAAALSSVKEEGQTSKLSQLADTLTQKMASGQSLASALEQSSNLPSVIIGLITLGEASGNLITNLNLAINLRSRQKVFNAAIKSAMLYPVLVIAVTLLVGLGVSWFALPKLAITFSQLRVELPLSTRVLISFGAFLSQNGLYVLPLTTLGLVILFYLLFILKASRRFGQSLLFSLPWLRRLIVETELSRFGYNLGCLLESGLPLIESLNWLSETTELWFYQKFYRHLAHELNEGKTFAETFRSYHRSSRLLPNNVQTMIKTAEKSSSLSKTFRQIGEIYADRGQLTTKNLAVLLEPTMLIGVWFGVLALAVSVISPIYRLTGSLNQLPSQPIKREVEPRDDFTLLGYKVSVQAVTQTDQAIFRLPDRQSEVVAKVQNGQAYEVIAARDSWYRIIVSNQLLGWIPAESVRKLGL